MKLVFKYAIFLWVVGLVFTACDTEIKTTSVSEFYDEAQQNLKRKYEVLQKDTTQKHGIYQSFYENGQLKMTLLYIKNKKNGLGTIYNEAGKKTEEAQFKNGMLNGVRKIYDTESDALKIEETYVDDNFEGPYKSYFTSGQIKQEGQYIDGAMNQLWKYYYPSGQLKEAVNFLNNVENGPYQAWHENGQLKAEGTYENENREGIWKVYHSNGVLEEEATYKKDWEEGLIEVFDSTGTKIKAITYKNGRVQNFERF